MDRVASSSRIAHCGVQGRDSDRRFKCRDSGRHPRPGGRIGDVSLRAGRDRIRAVDQAIQHCPEAETMLPHPDQAWCPPPSRNQGGVRVARTRGRGLCQRVAIHAGRGPLAGELRQAAAARRALTVRGKGKVAIGGRPSLGPPGCREAVQADCSHGACFLYP